MSTTDYLLNTAPFPEDYAERLIEILGITQSNFLSFKDALYHFRRLDDDQAAEVMRHVMEAATTPAEIRYRRPARRTSADRRHLGCRGRAGKPTPT